MAWISAAGRAGGAAADATANRGGTGLSQTEPWAMTAWGAEAIPADTTNLAWRGWQAAGGERWRPVQLEVEKAIPAGAGLGGGSADAAAAYRAAQCLLHAAGPASSTPGDPLTRLGADVPFAASAAPAAWGRGLGEELAPVAARAFRVILIKPAVASPTAQAYRWLDEMAAQNPREEGARRQHSEVRVQELVAAWPRLAAAAPVARAWADLVSAVGPETPNDLARAVYAHIPAVAAWREELARLVEKCCPGEVLYGLTGSGSALFVLAMADEPVVRLWEALTNPGKSHPGGPTLLLWTHSLGSLQHRGTTQVQMG